MPTIERPQGINPQGHRAGVGLVTPLNTDTGPRAHAGQFYVDLSGLQRGLFDLARTAGDMHERYQRAQDQMWAQKTGIEMRKHWWTRFAEAEASGQPLDPEGFEREYEQHLTKAMESAPSDRARMAAEMDLTEFGAGLFRQSLVLTARARAAALADDAMRQFQQLTTLMGNGADPDQVMDLIDQSIATIAPTLSPKQQAKLKSVRSEAAHARMGVMVRGIGPEGVAEQLRSGSKVGDHLDEWQRETLAVELEMKARADHEAVAVMEEAAVDDLDQHHRSGLPVPPEAVESAQRAAEQNREAAARPFNVVRFAEQAARLEQVGGREGSILQRNWQAMVRRVLPGTTPEERLEMLMELQERTGKHSSVFRTAQAEMTALAERLDPLSKSFDPAAVAAENKWFQQELVEARKAFFEAQVSGAGEEAVHAAANKVRMVTEKGFALQRAMGVPPGEERVFGNQEAERLAYSVATPDDARKFTREMERQLGKDLAGRAVIEVLGRKGSLPAAVKLAVMDTDNNLLWEAAKAGRKPEGAQAAEMLAEIESNELYRSYAASLASAAPGERVAMLDDMRSGLASIAAFYAADVDKTGKGIGNKEAVRAALHHTLGKAFAFVDMPNGFKVAFPRDWQLSGGGQPRDAALLLDQVAAVVMRNEQIKLLDYAGDQPGVSGQELKELQMAGRTWILEGDALTLFYEGTNGLKPVRVDDGSPFGRKVQVRREDFIRQNSEVVGIKRKHSNATSQAKQAVRKKFGQILGEQIVRDVLGLRAGAIESVNEPPPQADAESVTVPFRAERLGGVLRQMDGVFKQAGEAYGLDPALLAAIAMHETGNGTSRAAREYGNVMGISDSRGVRNWKGEGRRPEESVEHMARRLATSNLYRRFRETGRLEDLAAVYAPVGARNDPRGLNKHWVNGVRKFYRELTGREYNA